MDNKKWPSVWKVSLGTDYEIELPLMDLGDNFYIYSFDMTGESQWNRHAAKALTEKLAGYSYEGFVTVQTKSSGLCQELAREMPSYLELRKARKSFMQDPKHVLVDSITTQGKQELWIGREKYQQFQGKKLCFIDDVVSTGGTVDAALIMAKEIGFEISVIACVLTEGEERTHYKGIPLISLGNIPLPGSIADNE
ncbi:adenine phosphoribosyltransferase [Anaerotaenia torta]|uniref:phosphoribosyltransferase family protein n=1 Tax=Anaerotaenia torta TaxID=433293 RepID=UPI003D25D689